MLVNNSPTEIGSEPGLMTNKICGQTSQLFEAARFYVLPFKKCYQAFWIQSLCLIFLEKLRAQNHESKIKETSSYLEFASRPAFRQSTWIGNLS